MRNPGRFVILIFSLMMILTSVPARQRKGAIDWSSLKFLLGDWVGEGGGQPGQATAGGATFNLDLQKKVIIMRSFADYPASKDAPAFTFNGMMIIYPNSARNGFLASFFDSDSNVIQYKLALSEDQKTLTFTSDPSPSAPRFRLTYNREGDNLIKLQFEIAPPGNPDGFTKYVGGTLRRKTAN